MATESRSSSGASGGSASGDPRRSRLGAFLAELRRRRVFRALLGWGVVCFAVLQVIEPVLHALHLPDGVLTGVVVVLAVGFPATVVLAWIFDLSAGGITRTPDAPSEAKDPPPARRFAPLFAGLVATGALLGAGMAWLALRTPAPPVDADGRVSVAVADFANQTGEPALDALSGLLITSLEQSRRLKVLTRGRMLELLRRGGRENAERIDEALAREAGRQAGVRALLLASIQKLGTIYVVELRAVDPSKDHYLFTLREQALDQAAILPLIDRLSERSRAALSESRAEVQAAGVAVAAAVTPNLEAYRHYFRGKDAFARMDMENAEKAFREALRLEPRFALAQYELALAGMLMAGRDKALLRDAVHNAAGAPEKEAGLIGALEALDAGRFREAIRLSAALAERFPDDPDVLYLAENVHSWVGDFAATIRLLERLQRVSPDFSFSQMDYVYLLFMQGRAAEGQAFVRRVVEQGRSPGAGVVRGLASAVAGDLRAAIREVRAAGAQHPLGGWLLAQLLASDGQVREALAVHGDAGYYFFELSRAIALSYGGRLRDAERHLRAAMDSPEADRGQMAVLLHWLLAAAGDEAGARAAQPARDMAPAWDALAHFHAGDDARLAAASEALDPGWEAARLHAALRAWRGGRRTEALERFRALNQEWIWLVPYYRGMAAAEEGLHGEAVEALSAFERSFYGFMDALFHPWLQARARIQLARSLGALGRKAEARAMIELQLSRWREADADLPLLAEARALRRELERAGGTGKP